MTRSKRFFLVQEEDLSSYGDRLGFATKEEVEDALEYDPEAGLVVIYGVRLVPEWRSVLTLPEPDDE